MAKVSVRELSPALGAEITGFDPVMLRDEKASLELRDVFDERGILVFRDLDIDHASQVRLCEMLIRKDPAAKIDLEKEIVPEDNFYVSNKRPNSAVPFGGLRFHSDMMWSATPFQILSLYGVQVEEPSVPTQFVSATYAWAHLPADLRARAESLKAIHTAGEISAAWIRAMCLSPMSSVRQRRLSRLRLHIHAPAKPSSMPAK